MQYLQKLGKHIEQQWRELGYRHERFADLALTTLQSHAPHEQFSVDELVRWFCANRDVPPQAPDGVFGEPPIAGQHDGQQDVGVEIGGGQQAQFGEHGGLHLLCLVNQQHRSGQGGLDVRLPTVAQGLGATPAVMRAQLDAEELAHLAIEVGDIGLRPTDHADRHVALCCQRS